MYKDARKVPWLYCLDSILQKMSMHISTLREKARDETGVLPNIAAKLELRRKESAGMSIIKLDEDSDNYQVSREASSRFPITHIMRVGECFCSCGMWQEYGYPCVDAMVYYRHIEKKTLLQIIESDVVSEFYHYSYYQELMKRNIIPVVLDNLEVKKDLTCLPPVSVTKRSGRPATKRLRLGRSRFMNPEESNIICSLCNKRGHNKRTCIARMDLLSKESKTNRVQLDIEKVEETHFFPNDITPYDIL
jgi:SWIM zinc finger